MKRVQLVFLLVFLLISCKEKEGKEAIVVGNIPIMDYAALEPLLVKKTSKTYVINFWATWCAPCVKELPVFEKLRSNYVDKNVEVILVSLDFPKQLESKLIPFVKKKELVSQVILLDDPDQDTWIPKVHKNWSGAIPATLIYNSAKRSFFERSFEYEELEHEILKFLN